MSLFTLEPAVLSSMETWRNCRIYADCHLNVCASRLGLVQTSYQYHGGIPNGTYNLQINWTIGLGYKTWTSMLNLELDDKLEKTSAFQRMMGSKSS